MKIEIKSRFIGEVLFAHEQEGNTMRITLELAVKARANLSRADLYGANLSDANLTGANLYGAVGNGREVLSFVALEYSGVYTAEFMWIGCRKHPVKTWWKDSEKDAHTFTQYQIEWRAKNKRWIQGMIKNNPAVKTGHEK